MNPKLFIALIFFLVDFQYIKADNKVTLFDSSLNEFINVRDLAINKNSTEAYFTVQSPGQEIAQIAVIRKVNNQWTTPELLPFCDKYMYMEPFLTQDGKRLYFASDRPLSDTSDQRKDFDIWYVERNRPDIPWSAPLRLGAPVNSELDEFYPSLAANNNLYFTKVAPDGMGNDDIYYCKWTKNGYSEPILLDSNINSKGFEFNAFVSLNEDFIIFTKYNDPDGLGSGDLFISYKNADDTWEKATNLGAPINTKMMEYCPYYDEGNKILYFTSRRNSISPRSFSNISELQEYISHNENGLSKIYKFSIDLVK